MITNDNKGTYLVKNGQKHDNVIYERPLIETVIIIFHNLKFSLVSTVLTIESFWIFYWKVPIKEKILLNFYFKSFFGLIIDKTYIFFQSKNGLSTIFMIESFRNFLNSTYNRDSTYIFSWSEIHLSTVLIIESFRNFANSTYNREGAYNRVKRVGIEWPLKESTT